MIWPEVNVFMVNFKLSTLAAPRRSVSWLGPVGALAGRKYGTRMFPSLHECDGSAGELRNICFVFICFFFFSWIAFISEILVTVLRRINAM